MTLGPWLGWRAPSGARRAEKRRLSPGWEEVGQCGEEGEKVFIRQRRKGAEQAASWKVGIALGHAEGKTPQELSSPVDAEGRHGSGSRFLSGGHALLAAV